MSINFEQLNEDDLGGSEYMECEDASGGKKRTSPSAIKTYIENSYPAKFTDVGGIATTLTNTTGAVSVKGTLVHASEGFDNSADLANLAGFDTIGVVLDDGVAEGEPMYVVVSGIAEVLLEDGTASTHGAWVKGSGIQAGRADATNTGIPGETPADNITLNNGSIGAGSLANTIAEDGSFLQLNSSGGGTKFNIVFDFTLDSAPDSFTMTGYFNSEDADTCAIQAYNFLTSSWVTLITMTDRASSTLYAFGLGAEYYDADNSLSQIRFYQGAGGDNGRIYIDYMVEETTAATHFKEIGHCLESKDAGTDVLAKMAIHFN